MLKQLLHLRTLLIALFVMAGSKALSQSFVKVTDVSDLVEGETYILVNTAGTKALGAISTTSTKYGTIVDVSQTESTIVANSEKIAKLTLGGNSTDGYTFKSSINSQYLTWSSGNSLNTSSKVSNNNKWTISITSDGTTISNKATPARKIRFNSDRFACYATTTGTLVNLYKLDASKKETTTTIDASGITNTDVNTGKSAGFFSATVKDDSNNTIDGASVTWYSSKTSVATINSNGEVTLVAAGTTKITASYAGNDDYASSSDEYELTVTSSAPYVQPTEISFPLNNTGFGTSYNGTVYNITDSEPITNTINNLTVTYAGSGNHYLNDTQIRLYPNNKLTFEAPSGYEITNIVLIPVSGGTWTATISSNPGTYDNSSKTWTGSASLVEFSGGSGSGVRCDIASATVTLAVQKTTSDLSVTTKSSVELDITSANIHPTSTITYTTSSTGTVTFESDDTSVATVSSTGVITAQGEGTATITISQAADDTYKAGEQTVTVNVTDNRFAVVTNIDLPAAQKTLSVGDQGDFAPTATETEGFTGEVSYSYDTSDASVVNVDGTTFSAEAPGKATITITATPTGGNAENYKFATQYVEVTVMGETTLALSTSSVNPTYGADATVTATVPNGYSGTLEAKSSNESIATASVKGTTITITPVAVGEATITVTAPETGTFRGEATGTIHVTVAAPEGKTKAAAITVFEETFADCDGTGGNDGSWNGTIAQNDLFTDNSEWTFQNGNGANGCAKFGSSKYKGSATTPALGESGTLTLSFRAAAWDGSNEGTTLNLSVSAGTIDESSVTLTKGEFKTYTATISNATTKTTIKFEAANASNNRFFLDDVVVTKQGVALTAKLNDFGYATYCSEYPLNFSTDNGYSAWQVTGVGDEAITFEKVTGSVKGGTGLLLMGKPSAMVTLTSVDSETELTNNKLEGTLAPTYVKANEYYGLSGKQFLKVNPGTVPAGKALLPVVDNVGNVRTLSLVFVDPTTGIAETKTMTNEDAIYNLAGQRISKAQRGVNIVGGKKVLVK